MAKTKRRQLAALAALRDGKAVTGVEERIASCCDARLSEGSCLKDDPLVEYRIQRVIIKIPPLPQKCSSAITPVVAIKRRKRKAPLLEDTKAKAATQAGLKRRKRKVPGDVQQSVAVEEVSKSKSPRATKNHNSNGDVKTSRRVSNKSASNVKRGPLNGKKRSRQILSLKEVDSKQVTVDDGKINKVILKLGQWRSEKVIGFSSSATGAAGRRRRRRMTLVPASKRRRNGQQVRSKPPPVSTEEIELRNTGAADGDTASLIGLDTCSEQQTLGSTEKLLEVASTCIAQGRRNRASSPINTFKRKRGRAATSVLQASGKAVCTVETRELENGGVKENQHLLREENGAEVRAESLGNASLVRTSEDGAACQRASEIPAMQNLNVNKQRNSAGPPLGSFCSSQERNEPALQPMQPPVEIEEEDRKPPRQIDHLQLKLPFTGENGVFLVVKKEEELDVDRYTQYSRGKDVILKGAELIKRNNQLAIIDKRLDAAGGLKRWLLGKGLAQFVPIFENKQVDSLTLLQITMSRLKEMGMIPVGPRRKFMHALSCLTGRSPLTSAARL